MITSEEARRHGEMIALSDSQFLRTIRDITGRNVDHDVLEDLIRQRDFYRRQKASPEKGEKIREIQKKINDMMEIPEYITVSMDDNSHYDYIFKNGIVVNGREYRRLSCSAGQARNSTVVLCDVSIIDEVKRRINNGRKMDKPLAPSKFNAYFGLAGSATKLVSEPRFIVVPDYKNTVDFDAYFDTETGWNEDDDIEVRRVENVEMNRTDGMGLISPALSERWANELGLDYIPAQWCIRQSFIKGMVCTFPIHEFCEEVAGGNYIVNTIYKDENGEPIKADLRDYDLILTESQFKLWDSFDSVGQYISNCHENKLFWGVSQYTPKAAKDTLTLNYQFIQTLDLDEHDVKELCSQFVDWIDGVSYENYPYMLLYLTGIDDEEKLRNWMRSSDNWWVKSLILCPDLMNDKFVRTKIRDMIKTRIQSGCMGEICVDGNFQVMVSDPYAFMEHVCGLPVTGLLGKDEFYSNYWNDRGVTVVDSMRSPLTYRSEHVVAHLKKNEETEKWYRYCYLGFILNWYGHETVRYAGSDFDYDIVASTSNKIMKTHTYINELPVTYDAPKPKKILFTDDDLYRSDLFGFGSIIGSITNKSSIAYSMLPLIKRDYEEDSDEFKLTISRLQQCCVAQSKQIDKTKIGQMVKGIPKIWIEKQDDDTEQAGLYNRILLNKYPYFFKYRYKNARDDFKKYEEECNSECKYKFRMELQDLLKLERKTSAQLAFLDNYYKYMPLVYSDSPMNLLCRYIESIDFEIAKKIKESGTFDHSVLYNEEHLPTDEQYKAVIKVFSEFKKIARIVAVQKDAAKVEGDEFMDYQKFRVGCDSCLDALTEACNDAYLVTNCLVRYFYEENPKSSKELLWSICGQYLYDTLRSKSSGAVMFPVRDPDGDITYLSRTYRMKEVVLD